MITIFAGIGALLAAGTQLSSLGKLTWEDDKGRLLLAGLALLVALISVVIVIVKAFDVLKPVEISLDEVLADSELRKQIVKGPGQPYVDDGLDDLRRLVTSDSISDEEREAVGREIDGVLGRAAFLKTRTSFQRSWLWMLGAGFVGAAAIAFFAFEANPEDKAPLGAVVRPAPVPIVFSLSGSGEDKLRSALGKDCVKNPISALSVGGSAGAPVVVVLPSKDCTPQQFTLTSTLSVPQSLKLAPVK